MMKLEMYENDNEEEDAYSNTSYDRDPYESDEDFEDRLQDLDDNIDYNND